MRVAVLADIHGNLPALVAVLREVEDAGVDAVVLAGDLAHGPMPAQTLDALEQLGERAIWVRGNTDRRRATSPPTGSHPEKTGLRAPGDLVCPEMIYDNSPVD